MGLEKCDFIKYFVFNVYAKNETIELIYHDVNGGQSDEEKVNKDDNTKWFPYTCQTYTWLKDLEKIMV